MLQAVEGGQEEPRPQSAGAELKPQSKGSCCPKRTWRRLQAVNLVWLPSYGLGAENEDPGARAKVTGGVLL